MAAPLALVTAGWRRQSRPGRAMATDSSAQSLDVPSSVTVRRKVVARETFSPIRSNVGQEQTAASSGVMAARSAFSLCQVSRSGSPSWWLAVLPAAQEHVLAQEDGRERLLAAVAALSRAFALSVPHPKAMAIRDDVAFFQAVRAALAKSGGGGGGEGGDREEALAQLSRFGANTSASPCATV